MCWLLLQNESLMHAYLIYYSNITDGTAVCDVCPLLVNVTKREKAVWSYFNPSIEKIQLVFNKNVYMKPSYRRCNNC